ncbi:Sucrase/ferredoxin-like-domain-containing protein [Phyllosticta citriasiana]|uniref:Sucrase/ferredoxin-like-domain-containing protein n=1 Tax=Phyllosticta citriasiana TaxID=595635 RepID=A0ABR1KQ88_9PEZI
MASAIKNLWGRVASHSGSAQNEDGFSKAPKAGQLFPVTDPAVDGEDCLRDCANCTIKYPRKWSVDESDNMYGNIGGWNTHLIVATGKTDWVRDVADEKGSIMEAVDKCGVKPSNGKMMLSASDMPLPHEAHNTAVPAGAESPTTVLLLPAFTLVDNVTPSSVPTLIQNHVSTGPTNTQPLDGAAPPRPTSSTSAKTAKSSKSSKPLPKPTLPLVVRDCPHNYLILLCSHKTRDARCGQSAPLLRREFERHLRPLGLYRDLHDERPGGVGIYFINHVGGHKYAANVLIYRRAGSVGTESAAAHAGQVQENGDKEAEKEGNGTAKENREAAQCMWLARVRPEHCENIVKYTILQGKLLNPDRQLRGGFDRSRQLISW